MYLIKGKTVANYVKNFLKASLLENDGAVMQTQPI